MAVADPYIFWTPNPADMEATVVRFHPQSAFPPKSLIEGDYIFFCQEDITIEPGKIKPIYVDADITTYGKVTFVEFPIPGPQWYSPQMSHFYSGPSGYYRLFQLVRVRNVHQQPITIKAGEPICRVLMDRNSSDDELYTQDPRVISDCLWLYRSVTTTQAHQRGLEYYNSCRSILWELLPGRKEMVREYTDMYGASLSA